ncbi:MAG: hypothetical protein ABWK01_05600 [Infirmifilum sp.]
MKLDFTLTQGLKVYDKYFLESTRRRPAPEKYNLAKNLLCFRLLALLYSLVDDYKPFKPVPNPLPISRELLMKTIQRLQGQGRLTMPRKIRKSPGRFGRINHFG